MCGRGIEEEKRVGLDPQVVKGEPPSSPDMLRKAEQSLTMPHQEDKTSSMEGCRQKAIKRLRNPPVMIEETSNRTSEKDRVVLQHYHNEELRMKGETTMPDQGIVFDESQKPRETRPGQKIKTKGFNQQEVKAGQMKK